MDSAGNYYQGIYNQSNLTIDAGELIISGLTDSKVVGQTGGHLVTDGVTTDWLTEGANLYFTTARARAAITGTLPVTVSGGVVSLGYNTSNFKLTVSDLNTIQDITTGSSPQFARLSDSSVGSFNTLLGSSSGGNITTGAKNVAIGSQSLALCTSGENNTAAGFTAGYAVTTGGNNVMIGNSAGRGSTALTTGNYGVYIGAGSYPGASNTSRELVFGDTTGNGSNTCTIRATLGLYVSNLTTGVLKSNSAGLITSTATTTDLTEGTNLYYTDTRARGAFSAGTGISIAAGVITNTAPATIASITGTANQVIVTGTTALTLSTPQDIGTASTPQFAGLTLTGLSGVIKASGGVLSGSATTDDMPEGKTNLYYTDTRARGAFSAGTGISIAAGVITNTAPATIASITGTANQVIVTGTTALTLSTPQDIGTASSPQFATLALSSIGTNNIIYSDPVNITSGAGNCILGALSGKSITTGGQNIALGFTTMSGAASFLTNAAGHNIAIGTGSLNILQGAAQYNLAVGAYSGQNLTTSSYNIFYGYYSGHNVSTSGNNIAIGNYAIGSTGTKLTAGGRNVAIGDYAGYTLNGTAYANVAVGLNALYFATASNNNTAVGQNAGSYLTTGSNNTCVGGTSLGGVTTGTYNVAIGYNTMTGLTSGSYNSHFGVNTQASIVDVSNEMVLNSTASTAVGKGANTCFISASAGLYATLPTLAQFPVINSTATVATSAGFMPYYSFQASTNAAVQYFNRGIALMPTSIYGGYWLFTKPGIYKITANMNIFIVGSSTTFIGSVATLGATTGIANYGVKFWEAATTGYTGWTLVTLINITNTSLYYFMSEYTSLTINASMNGCAGLLIEWVSAD